MAIDVGCLPGNPPWYLFPKHLRKPYDQEAGTFSLLGQALTKVLTFNVLRLNLLYLPIVILGGLMGYLVFQRLSSRVFSRILLYVLLAVGLFLTIS